MPHGHSTGGAAERRRILVVTNDFPPRVGGIESFVAALCQRLPAEDLVVYTARMRGAAAVDAGLGFPVVRDRLAMLVPTPRVARRAAGLARAYGCDRVVFGAAAPLGLLAGPLRRAGVRRVVALTHGHEVWWSRLPGARRALRRIADGADVLTYVSEYCRARIATAAGPLTTMTRLSPGVDLDQFRPLDAGQSLVRATLGLPADRPLVVSPSRLVRRKGHDVLLRAWPAVLARHPAAVLAIVGDGHLRPELERTIRRRGMDASAFVLPGVPWSQMPRVYAGAQALALPCRTRLLGLEPEALGIVFLEAAACGLPVVVGRSGGTPETVLDGETGYLVDPSSPRDVARRIGDLLADPDRAAVMGARGRTFVAETFEADRAGRLLRRLLALDGSAAPEPPIDS